jgi:hypothetical protein
MSNELIVTEQDHKESVVVSSARAVTRHAQVIQFNGRAMVLENVRLEGGGEMEQYVPLHKDRFERLAYPVLGGVSRSRMADVFAYVIHTAPDYSEYGHLVKLGEKVWDSRALKFVEGVTDDVVVWRSPYEVVKKKGPVPFVLRDANVSSRAL